MPQYYFLWATGKDRSGFVAAITGELFSLGCNLEDSSMMRLGAEFAVFLIFTSSQVLSDSHVAGLEKLPGLNVGLKKISAQEARFTQPKRDVFIVRVYGPDRPGIVYRVTACLAKHKFNITDLSTHRTTHGKKAGYILLIEGELLGTKSTSALKRNLNNLEKKLKTKISFDALPSQTF